MNQENQKSQESRENWGVRAIWDPRFGFIQLNITLDDQDKAVLRLPLKNFIEQLNIKRAELDAILNPKYAWTEGVSDIEPARRRLLEQADWKGKAVLDVGGYDGFAAKMALDGGAKRAICLDSQQYEHYGWDDKKAEGVEYVMGDMMDYTAEGKIIHVIDNVFSLPRPDALILYNVLYHVKNPWLFLEKARELIKPDGEMFLCTLFRYQEGSWVYLYEGRECNHEDESVFWGPSIEALERLLRFTGWEAEMYALAYDRVVYHCKPIEPQGRQSKW